MRVLFLSKYDVQVGGVAEVKARLAANLMLSGIEVLTISSHPSARRGTLANGLSCSHSELPAPGVFRYWRNRSAVTTLVDFCRAKQIELIHAHGAYRPAYAALVLKRKLGIPYVVTSHGDLNPVSNPRLQSRSGRRRYRELLRHADAVTHLSPRLQQYANALTDIRGKSHLIPNGIDNAWWNAQPPARDGGRCLLAVGRLAREKGFDPAIRAYRHALDHGIRLPLVIAGEGEERQRLQQLAAELGLRLLRRAESGPGVCFPGYVTGADKRKLFAEAAVFLFPSLEEAFPVVLLEAMAAGKAIVASDIPAVRELVADGENGAIVAGNDPAIWARKIVPLAADECTRALYGERCRTIAKRYDWTDICERYIGVYAACRMPHRKEAGGMLRPKLEPLA